MHVTDDRQTDGFVMPLAKRNVVTSRLAKNKLEIEKLYVFSISS